MNINNLVDSYITDIENSKTNANLNFSNSGLKSYISDNVLKEYALDKFGNFGNLHRIGALHLHNLDSGPYTPYCAGHSFENLLMKGLINPVGISSKPAKHFDVAMDHLVNYTYTMTQEFSGAQAFNDIDILSAPYIFYDNLHYEDVKQTIQRLVWNLSYPLRSGFQSVFLNFSLGLRPSSFYYNKPIVHPKSAYMKEGYKTYQKQINMFNRALLEVMIEGSDNHPFTFPLLTYKITKDFDWNSDISNLIFQYAAKWGGPYFSNYINTDFKENDALSMCCRLHLNINEVQKITGGLWSFGNNTGSLAVATINMAQLGYLTKGDEEAFYNRLNTLLEEAKNYLILKKSYILKGIDLGLYPMIKNYMGKKMANTFFLTIGINGLNECSINFCGKNILENSLWCEQVLVHIKQKTLEFQQETRQLINFEGVPAEGCSHSLAKIDKRNTPEIFTQGSDNSVYYTGSSFIPYNIQTSLNDAILHQEKLQQHYTGGTVFHIDTGEQASPESVKKIVKRICENTKLPYLTWSPTFCTCPEHGQTYGKEMCCSQGEVMSRIVGFYRPISRWNAGKKSEFDTKEFLKI